MLASKAEIKDDVAEIRVIKNTLRATTTDLTLIRPLTREIGEDLSSRISFNLLLQQTQRTLMTS